MCLFVCVFFVSKFYWTLAPFEPDILSLGGEDVMSVYPWLNRTHHGFVFTPTCVYQQFGIGGLQFDSVVHKQYGLLFSESSTPTQQCPGRNYILYIAFGYRYNKARTQDIPLRNSCESKNIISSCSLNKSTTAAFIIIRARRFKGKWTSRCP